MKGCRVILTLTHNPAAFLFTKSSCGDRSPKAALLGDLSLLITPLTNVTTYNGQLAATTASASLYMIMLECLFTF